mmetsp:Transcript_12830/g.24084  ORF Transcript_12830/g.24084 Transcript_12830/m.24084 type:complete len:483 (-) Transcript_12830:1401-2849(-)|eukprot:CAMPEP_0176500278 /NCGR_PEP_ID=MMETSP0200_2-20121128/13435_1 /TAXON_ID=947934 /ORGANISM="Chaetoceros sp., Strain GSL56" /LENGTH=482 /DNA_ID=CAMNT_0017898873 /DNA_START=141 /DNA_END=1589 /DNA_ORIENTATION=-
MRFSRTSLAAILLSETSYFCCTAFTVPSISFAKKSALHAANEFDHLLGEGTQSSSFSSNISRRGIDTNKIIGLPDSSAAATLTSSLTFEEATAVEDEGGDYENDIYGDGMEDQASQSLGEVKDPRLAEIIRKEQQKVAMKSQPVERTPLSVKTLNYLKGKDFGEIFFTVLVPVIAGYYFTKKAYEKVSSRVGGKADEMLDDYANEMIYHDGDFDEMKLAHEDYSKKLVFLGPKKSDSMIKRYLEFYAKKKTVSPQAISSLSYVFFLHKLTEERAGEVLAELCASMPEKVASAGKLLFFGEHILKTPQGKAKLKPIKDLLASSYRDDGVVSGDEIVRKSQLAMAEAAYRAAVAAAGKKQTELTIGWEVLGLDKETAMKIFKEVAGEGFLTQREAKYATKQQKFDAKGRKIDDDGKMENPEEADKEKDDADVTSASGNVQECSECGFTLFVAAGRDSKFFNSGFKCPECGASKDKFKSPDIDLK